MPMHLSTHVHAHTNAAPSGPRRPILMSEAFKLSIRNGTDVVVSGHADWLEVLALASKHRYADLFTRCTNFLLEQARERPVLLATNFITGSQQLKELRQARNHGMLGRQGSPACSTASVVAP